MIKKTIITAFLALGVFWGWAFAESPAYQETGATKFQTATLMPLVGQRCTILLLSGEELKGTLWDVGDDYVTLKLRKGLLYSKADKYSISEIAYIEDETGKKYIIAENVDEEDIGETTDGDLTNELYFQTDDLIRPEEPTKPYNNYSALNNPYNKPAEQPEPAAENLKSEDVTSEESTPTPEMSAAAARNKIRGGAKEKAAQPKVIDRPAIPRAYDSDLVAPPKPRASESTAATPLNKKQRILNYQIKILFGVAVFAIGLVIFLKLIGMKGSAYGKHSLFPARVVRMNGQYGIIDQGGNDGVKKDDIIRLYRKKGRKIQFKAKVRVIKVENSYSAVELVKGNRRVRPEVGDVGFRDRNFVAAAFKKLRIITSAILGVLARVFDFASRNIKVETATPVIKIDMFDNESQTDKSRPDAKIKSRSSARTKLVDSDE